MWLSEVHLLSSFQPWFHFSGANLCAEQTAIVKAIVSLQPWYYISALISIAQSEGVHSFVELAVAGSVASQPDHDFLATLRSPIPSPISPLSVVKYYANSALPIRIFVPGNSHGGGERETTLRQLLPDSPSSDPRWLELSMNWVVWFFLSLTSDVRLTPNVLSNFFGFWIYYFIRKWMRTWPTRGALSKNVIHYWSLLIVSKSGARTNTNFLISFVERKDPKELIQGWVLESL